MPLIISLCLLGKPLIANSPQNPSSENWADYNDLFLEARYVPTIPKTVVLGDIIATKEEEIRLLTLAGNKYPEYAKLLYCLCREESGFNQNVIPGDNGLAHSWFQIHYIENGITKECAYDLECSMNWTIGEIKAGNSWKWTTYNKCLAETS